MSACRLETSDPHHGGCPNQTHRMRTGQPCQTEHLASRWCAVGCIDMTSGIAAWLVRPALIGQIRDRLLPPLRIQGRFSCRVLSLHHRCQWGCASFVPNSLGDRGPRDSDSEHDVTTASDHQPCPRLRLGFLFAPGLGAGKSHDFLGDFSISDWILFPVAFLYARMGGRHR